MGATAIHFISRLVKDSIDPVIALIYSMAAAFVVSLCFYPLAAQSLQSSFALNKATAFCIALGICTAVAQLGIYLMFKSGAPMSLATPLVRFAPAIFATVLGLAFFQESLKLHHYFGLAFAFLGFYLITKP